MKNIQYSFFKQFKFSSVKDFHLDMLSHESIYNHITHSLGTLPGVILQISPSQKSPTMGFDSEVTDEQVHLPQLMRCSGYECLEQVTVVLSLQKGKTLLLKVPLPQDMDCIVYKSIEQSVSTQKTNPPDEDQKVIQLQFSHRYSQLVYEIIDFLSTSALYSVHTLTFSRGFLFQLTDLHCHSFMSARVFASLPKQFARAARFQKQ